jgi:autotransporter-associated beta strand protein
MILTGVNTFTGPTTISAGTLQLGGAAGSVAGDIVNNSALVADQLGTVTLPGVISGAGTLTKQNTGTLILTADNTPFSGPVTVSNGTLRAANAAGSATGTGPVAVGGAGTLDGTGTVAGPVALNDGGSIRGGTGGATAAHTLNLPGGLTLDGANSFLTVVADTQYGNAQADPTGSLINLGSAVLSRNTGGAVSDLTTIRLSAAPLTLEWGETYTVPVATYGSTANLVETNFTIDPNPTGFFFDNDLTPFLTMSGTTLSITFVPVPEPGAVLGVVALAGLAAAGLRRRFARPAVA